MKLIIILSIFVMFMINPVVGFIMFISSLIIYLVIKDENKRHINDHDTSDLELSDEEHNTNIWDDHASSYLKCIQRYGRVTFKNLIIDSYSGNTPHAEIDEVIVSPFGIFCIEYKAHCGIIFGSANQKKWTQCKYNGNFSRNNPLHQNYKHVRALEDLLGDDLKAKIQSYVVYTNAVEIHVDSDRVFKGVRAMEFEISKHNNKIYSLDECQQILKIFAIANAHSRSLREIHVSEVQQYLATVNV